MASSLITWLLNPHCAAEMKKAPPTVVKTGQKVSS